MIDILIFTCSTPGPIWAAFLYHLSRLRGGRYSNAHFTDGKPRGGIVCPRSLGLQGTELSLELTSGVRPL